MNAQTCAKSFGPALRVVASASAGRAADPATAARDDGHLAREVRHGAGASGFDTAERCQTPFRPLVQLPADRAARERGRVVVDVVRARVLAQRRAGGPGVRSCDAALLDVARTR